MNVSGEAPVKIVQVKTARRNSDSCVLCRRGLCDSNNNVNMRCSQCAHLPAAHHVDRGESGQDMSGVVQVRRWKGWRTMRVGRAK